MSEQKLYIQLWQTLPTERMLTEFPAAMKDGLVGDLNGLENGLNRLAEVGHDFKVRPKWKEVESG